MLNLLKELVSLYGVGAVSTVQEVAFADTDFHLGSLVSLLTRLIIQKCDKTEINLQDSAQSLVKVTKAFKSMNANVFSKTQQNH